MTVNNNSISCKIFVGFGGSGAKTLLDLAKMFAADKEWAQRCETEAYFLLADTDLGDLRSYEEKIRATLARVSAHPFVATVELSEGVPRMDQLITDQLTTAMASKHGLPRVKEAWWFNEKDEPFIARNVQLPPSKGASQCPAISHFLAWNSVGGVDSKIGSVINRMHNAMASNIATRYGASVKKEVRVFLVAGLAGGTGRGSWATLSYKIADIFGKKGFPVTPIGVFFDQTCFSNVIEGAQNQRTKMLVNSLTGISEITGWIENDSDRFKNRRYKFRLPSFSDPANPDADLINVENLIASDSHAGLTPVSQAYIIFRDNEAGALGADQHYKVAAAALYGRTANSEIDSQLSNTRQYLGSLGASLYRVEVDGIRNFMAKKLEYEATAKFVKSDSVTSASDIADIILLPLVAVEADRCKTSAATDVDPRNPQFLARLNAAVLAAKAGKLNALVDELESLGAEDRASAVNALSRFEASNERLLEEVANAIRKSIQTTFNESFVPARKVPVDGIIAHYVRKALMSGLPNPASPGGDDVDAHRQSITVAQAVIEVIKGRLAGLGDKIAPKKDKLAYSPGDAIELIEKRSGKALGFIGKRFSDSEKEEIAGFLRSMVVEQGQAMLKSLFKSWCEPLQKLLGVWSENLKLGLERAKAHAEKAGKEVGADQMDELFTTDRDFEKAKRPPMPYADGGRDPERQLEPLGLEENVKKWMKQLETQRDERFELAIGKIRTAILEHAYSMAGSGEHEEDVNKKFKRDLAAMFKSLGSNVVVPPEFIQRNFRLSQVAEELVNEWARRIDLASNNQAAQRNMERKFGEIFGFNFDKLEGQCVVPDRKEIIEKMALRLGQNCKAQYMARESSAMTIPDVHTLVFLPTDKYLVDSDNAVKEWKKELKQMAAAIKAPITFHLEQEGDEAFGEDCRGNPFLLLAVVTEGFPSKEDSQVRDPMVSAPADFDLVSSMDYWRAQNDPHLKTYLEWVEDPYGKSMFADVKYSFGLGYILPAFVNNKSLREARWRPWARSIENEVARKSNISVDAILYGLLGTKESKSPLLQLSVADDNGTNHRWTLPLLKFGPAGSTKNAFTFLRQAFTNESGGWRPKAREFEAGHHESSVKKLVDLMTRDANISKAIMKEAAHYFGSLCFTEGFIDRDVKQLFLALSDWIHEHLRGELERLPNFEEYRPMLEQLEERATELSTLSREELCEIYKG